MLYCSLIRSLLVYASLIWYQNLSINKKYLDNVQYTFLKRLAFLTNVPISRYSFYTVQELTGIDSLNLKRKFADVSLGFDLSNVIIICPKSLTQISFHIPYLFP